MNQPVRLTIRFDGLGAADAGRAADSLRSTLQEVVPTIQANRIRIEPEAMDFGTSLELILAAPAIIEVAKGISNWLARTHSSKVTVIGPDGSTVVENISARDAASLAEKLQRRYGER